MLKFVVPAKERIAALLEEEKNFYADALVRYGEMFDEHKALRLSASEINYFLPDGADTEDIHFFELYTDDVSVGHIWYQLADSPEELSDLVPPAMLVKPQAFLAYLYIEPEHRRKGYAQEAMAYYERHAHQLGADVGFFYVFKKNLEGIALYNKLGYLLSYEAAYNDAHEDSRCCLYKVF